MYHFLAFLVSLFSPKAVKTRLVLQPLAAGTVSWHIVPISASCLLTFWRQNYKNISPDTPDGMNPLALFYVSLWVENISKQPMPLDDRAVCHIQSGLIRFLQQQSSLRIEVKRDTWFHKILFVFHLILIHRCKVIERNLLTITFRTGPSNFFTTCQARSLPITARGDSRCALLGGV